MATRDMFLDALAPAPVARSPVPVAPPAASPPPRPPAPPPTSNQATLNSNQGALKAGRPDFADDIDRIVGELVAAGDVVWDASIDAYRKPHCRRFRFEQSSMLDTFLSSSTFIEEC